MATFGTDYASPSVRSMYIRVRLSKCSRGVASQARDDQEAKTEERKKEDRPIACATVERGRQGARQARVDETGIAEIEPSKICKMFI